MRHKPSIETLPSTAPQRAHASAHEPDAAFGQVNAAFNTARHLASALGAATIVAIVGADASLAVFDRAFLFLGVNVVVGAAIIWFVYPHQVGVAARRAVRAG